MQKPSIGRVVHINLNGDGRRVAASVSYVHNDTCIDVIPIGDPPKSTRSKLTFAEETPESAAKVNEIDISSMQWVWPPRV